MRKWVGENAQKWEQAWESDKECFVPDMCKDEYLCAVLEEYPCTVSVGRLPLYFVEQVGDVHVSMWPSDGFFVTFESCSFHDDYGTPGAWSLYVGGKLVHVSPSYEGLKADVIRDYYPVLLAWGEQ